MTNYEMVKEFHRIFGVDIGEKPGFLSKERQALRTKLMREELKEYTDAIKAKDLLEAADALADLLYVVYGTAIEHGFNADDLVREVHRSNMSKRAPCPDCRDGYPLFRRREKDQRCQTCMGKGKVVLMRDDGKVLKGPDFFLPDIAGVLGV